MCGSATHPGGGIMGAPGRIAALEFLKEPSAAGSRWPEGGAATTRSSSAPATTAWSPRRIWRRPASRSWCWSAATRWAGSWRTRRSRPGSRRRGSPHTVGRLRQSVVKDLKLPAYGLELLEPEVRVFAPQPDGSAVTFWGDPVRTAAELRGADPHDAAAYPAFDRKVRAIASFLAYMNAITPPDAKSPSIGDAIAGLKLGKAFRDLGAKTGREAIRALPMAVADLVAEVFEDEAVRGPARVARRAVHLDGPVGGGHGGRVPDGLRRQRRRGAGTVDDRQGRDRRAGRRAAKRAPRRSARRSARAPRWRRSGRWTGESSA